MADGVNVISMMMMIVLKLSDDDDCDLIENVDFTTTTPTSLAVMIVKNVSMMTTTVATMLLMPECTIQHVVSSDKPAYTLHVYAPGLKKMKIFRESGEVSVFTVGSVPYMSEGGRFYRAPLPSSLACDRYGRCAVCCFAPSIN